MNINRRRNSAQRAIKKSESRASKRSKARAVPANERSRHDRNLASGQK